MKATEVCVLDDALFAKMVNEWTGKDFNIHIYSAYDASPRVINEKARGLLEAEKRG